MAKGNIEKLECLLVSDLKFLANFLVAPAEAIKSEGIDLTGDETRRAEAFAKSAQEQVRLAGSLSGFQTSDKADWGIGFGCCNSSSLMILEKRDSKSE